MNAPGKQKSYPQGFAGAEATQAGTAVGFGVGTSVGRGVGAREGAGVGSRVGIGVGAGVGGTGTGVGGAVEGVPDSGRVEIVVRIAVGDGRESIAEPHATQPTRAQARSMIPIVRTDKRSYPPLSSANSVLPFRRHADGNPND
jgi:hypothetical protein